MANTKTDLVSTIFQFSDKIKNNRTEKDIMLSLQEEIGELALELKITNGLSYKEPSSDGVIGEAIDAINCLVDLMKARHANSWLQLWVSSYNICNNDILNKP